MIDRWEYLLRGLSFGAVFGAVTGGSKLNVQVFSTPGAYVWQKPSSGTIALVLCIGAGGGGASGSCGAALSARRGGSGGGGGGFSTAEFALSDLPASVAVQVGQGGAGGAAILVNATPGAAGIAGTRSRFGPSDANSFLSAEGGALGANAAAGNGGPADYYGGDGAVSSAAGGNGSTSTSTQDTLTLARRVVGGSSGGGITAANADSNGGAGAMPQLFVQRTPAVGGVAPGGVGPAASTVMPANAVASAFGSPSGAGGAGSSVGPAGAGGNGIFGSGGSGGGASLNGNASGKGGDGGNGLVIVITA